MRTLAVKHFTSMKLKLTENSKGPALSLSKGFTLIELLIVIVIIGVLTSLLVVNFVGVRVRARDAQRKSDLRQIQSALELYRADKGVYPTFASTSPPVNCPPAPTPPTSFGNPPSCTATYMQKVPRDPSTSSYNGGSYYYSASSDTTYTLAACLENANDSDQNSTETFLGEAPSCITDKYYVLTNP